MVSRIKHLENFGLASDEMVATGHGFDGQPVRVWHTNAMMPAMGLRSSVPDYLDWIQIIHSDFATHEFKLSRALRKEINLLGQAGAYKVYQGWFMIPSGKVIVLYHNGHTGGHHVNAVYSPAEEKAVVVFANGKAGANDLALSILTMLRRG
jgi:hypothetical protein